MSKSPLVTIGVPVYNGEKYIEECIESIHNQTYDNFECYVINNRSTDNTLALAESVAKKDPRIKVITNPEFVDMTTNFNNTFKQVCDETKYFKAVCADDWLFPESIERMVNLLEKYPSAGICSSYRMDGNEVNCFGLDYKKGNLFNGKEILFNQLRGDADILGSETTVLYRLETLKKISGFPNVYNYSSYHIDSALAYELISISDLCFDFQVLSFTRRHESSYTSKYADRFRTNLNFREKELYKYKTMFPELSARYKKTRAQYGAFLFKAVLKRDKDVIEWHNKWLDKDRRFTFSEYLQCWFRNTLDKILNKLKGEN
jgi:glycosyltransferase involved in cell wall biosynthesis